jgi:hypothetical protein
MPLHFAPQMMSKVGRKEDKLMNEWMNEGKIGYIQ